MLQTKNYIQTEGPHNIDAEQALLGAIIVENRTMDACAALKPSDFYDPIHAALFDAMRQQWQLTQSVNAVTLKAALADLPDITEELNPFRYVERLISIGDTSNPASLVAVIREMALRRDLVAAGEHLALRARHLPTDAITAANLAVQSIDDVMATARGGKATRTSLFDAFSRVLDAALNPDTSDRITTGLADLDKAIGGWRRKQYAVLAGRPGMGKTAVALSSAVKTAVAGHGVMYFSLEMPTEALGTRVLSDLSWSHTASIPYQRALAGSLSDADAGVWGASAGKFASLPFVIDDQRGLTMAEIGARVRAQAQRFERDGKSLGLVVVDHLGLIKASGRYAGNKVQETGEISDALATLAKDANVAVVALHQLNRATEGRDNKRPTLADLRNSGDIEQDADVVCFAYREAYYLERMKFDAGTGQEYERRDRLDACRSTLEVLIGKNRNGPTDTVTLFCDMACNAVRDAALPTPPPSVRGKSYAAGDYE